ncbi:MAG: biphenyl 2,3-dioxygenase [Gammaproteobacteria bacterium]|nr:biphenyl 2,3-dioxygenase [Gammaproteobacteria bacterium]
MSICSLGYIRIAATDLNDWRRLGVDALGLMPSEGPSGQLHLRTDDRPFRFSIESAERNGFIAAGWELGGPAQFADCLAVLERAGIKVQRGSAEDARARSVTDFITIFDPSGNCLELYYGRFRSYQPFVSQQGVSGFVAGDLGMGHVVLPAAQLEATHQFYKNLLGFDDTDEMRIPISPDPTVPLLQILFMHCISRRHHSLALAPMPAPSGLVHAMIEARTIDDVGRALERCIVQGRHISSSFGRHSNDNMLSFYVATPGGFDIEFGCDGLMPDWSTWVPTRSLVPDLWGHAWAPPPATRS